MTELPMVVAMGRDANRWDVRHDSSLTPDPNGMPLVSGVMTTYKNDVEVLWRAIESISLRGLRCPARRSISAA